MTMIPWLFMSLSTLLISILVMLVYKWVSDQTRIARCRNLIVARVLEIRLYQDDLVAVITAPVRVFVACLRYLVASLKPLAILLVPMMLLPFLCAGWLEYRPLKTGEQTLVTVCAEKGAEPLLLISPGLVVETDALRIPSANETVWRLRVVGGASAPTITVRSGAHELTRLVAVSPALAWISPGIPGWSAMAVEIQYPRRDWHLAAWQPHWLVVFFALVLGWCLVLMVPLRVEM